MVKISNCFVTVHPEGKGIGIFDNDCTRTHRMHSSLGLGIKVRCLQQKCKLSTMQAESVKDLLHECSLPKPNLRKADRVMNGDSGAKKVVLHGCIGKLDNGQQCQHVYGPLDQRIRCPRCNHGRYKEDGTANETVNHFPIRERLKALLELPNFIKLLQVNRFE